MKAADQYGIPTAPGVFEMPFDEYKRIRALNSHALEQLFRSPLHLKTYLDDSQNGRGAPPSHAMKIGTGFDLKVLEPDQFNAQIVADLAINKNKKIYKSWKHAQDQAGKTILPQKDIRNIERMAEKVRAHPKAAELLSAGWPKRVFLWLDPDFGFWCKAEIDWIPAAIPGALVDLKKTVDASRWKFQRSVWNYKYSRQAWWYLRGATAATGAAHNRFFWIAWEDQPPHEGNVFEADPAEIERESDRAYQHLELYARCIEDNHWPGYPAELVELGDRRPAFEPTNDAFPF